MVVGFDAVADSGPLARLALAESPPLAEDASIQNPSQEKSLSVASTPPPVTPRSSGGSLECKNDSHAASSVTAAGHASILDESELSEVNPDSSSLPLSSISIAVPWSLTQPSPARVGLPQRADRRNGSEPNPNPLASVPSSQISPAEEEARARQLQALFMTSMQVTQDGAEAQAAAVAGNSDQVVTRNEKIQTLEYISVHVVTWNMNNRKRIVDEFGPILPPGHDIYVLGTQECSLDREKLAQKIVKSLGEDVIELRLEELQSIKLCVYCRKDLFGQIENVETADIPTKLGGMLKTKGGIGLSLKIADTSFLFINSHLSAHQGAVAERNKDFKTICTGMPLPHQDHVEQAFQLISSFRRSRNVSEMFDRVFWMGDLNYRVDIDRSTADQRIVDGKFLALLQYDQLSLEREKGAAFSNFSEEAITFKPTYKYDRGTTVYDTSEKQRVPSWTDRVLYRTKLPGSIRCLEYESCESMMESDHRPVRALFRVHVPGGKWRMRDYMDGKSLKGLMGMVQDARLTKDHTTALVGLSSLSSEPPARNVSDPPLSTSVPSPSRRRSLLRTLSGSNRKRNGSSRRGKENTVSKTCVVC